MANSRLSAGFVMGGVRVRVRASLDSFTDESNNDVLLGSRQEWWLARRRSGPEISIKLPLSLIAQVSERNEGPYFSQRLGFMPPGELFKLPSRTANWAAKVLAETAAFCRGIKYYGASQFTNPGSCPVSFEIEQEGKHLGRYRLRGHARLLYNIYSASRADSDGRYRQFIDVVGPNGLKLIDELTFREVPTASVDFSVRVGGRVESRKRRTLLVIPQFKIGRHRLSPNQLSEGTFKTLALLFHVMCEDSPAVLVEEPEVCVHHGLLSSILELIKTYSEQKQIVLSTHSDYVLDHVNPESVYRVAYERTRGTSVRHVPGSMTASEYRALREYLQRQGNLGEYWREGGLGDRP